MISISPWQKKREKKVLRTREEKKKEKKKGDRQKEEDMFYIQIHTYIYTEKEKMHKHILRQL